MLLIPVTSPGRAFQLEGFRSGLNYSRQVMFETAVQVSSTFVPDRADDKRSSGRMRTGVVPSASIKGYNHPYFRRTPTRLMATRFADGAVDEIVKPFRSRVTSSELIAMAPPELTVMLRVKW